MTSVKSCFPLKSPGRDGFTGEFPQTFGEELTPLRFQLFQKIREEERPPSSFYKAAIILIPKPHRHYQKNKNKKIIGQ